MTHFLKSTTRTYIFARHAHGCPLLHLACFHSHAHHYRISRIENKLRQNFYLAGKYCYVSKRKKENPRIFKLTKSLRSIKKQMQVNMRLLLPSAEGSRKATHRRSGVPRVLHPLFILLPPLKAAASQEHVGPRPKAEPRPWRWSLSASVESTIRCVLGPVWGLFWGPHWYQTTSSFSVPRSQISWSKRTLFLCLWSICLECFNGL